MPRFHFPVNECGAALLFELVVGPSPHVSKEEAGLMIWKHLPYCLLLAHDQPSDRTFLQSDVIRNHENAVSHHAILMVGDKKESKQRHGIVDKKQWQGEGMPRVWAVDIECVWMAYWSIKQFGVLRLYSSCSSKSNVEKCINVRASWSPRHTTDAWDGVLSKFSVSNREHSLTEAQWFSLDKYKLLNWCANKGSCPSQLTKIFVRGDRQMPNSQRIKSEHNVTPLSLVIIMVWKIVTETDTQKLSQRRQTRQ